MGWLGGLGRRTVPTGCRTLRINDESALKCSANNGKRHKQMGHEMFIHAAWWNKECKMKMKNVLGIPKEEGSLIRLLRKVLGKYSQKSSCFIV